MFSCLFSIKNIKINKFTNVHTTYEDIKLYYICLFSLIIESFKVGNKGSFIPISYPYFISIGAYLHAIPHNNVFQMPDNNVP